MPTAMPAARGRINPTTDGQTDRGRTAGRFAAVAIIVNIISRLGLENGEMGEKGKESMHYLFLPSSRPSFVLPSFDRTRHREVFLAPCLLCHA